MTAASLARRSLVPLLLVAAALCAAGCTHAEPKPTLASVKKARLATELSIRHHELTPEVVEAAQSKLASPFSDPAVAKTYNATPPPAEVPLPKKPPAEGLFRVIPQAFAARALAMRADHHFLRAASGKVPYAVGKEEGDAVVELEIKELRIAPPKGDAPGAVVLQVAVRLHDFERTEELERPSPELGTAEPLAPEGIYAALRASVDEAATQAGGWLVEASAAK